MNLLLVEESDVQADGTVRLTGRRLLHAREVLKAQEGATLRVGMLGGKTGVGTLRSITSEELALEVTFDTPPPPRANVHLLLALPRPKALKKILPALASLGVDRVFLLNAARVEKSYWNSDVLAPEAIDELLRLGLEQGRDTLPPAIILKDRFRPFVEDELPTLTQGAGKFVLDPSGASSLPQRERGASTFLAIGPEGGWVPFELELLEAHGFTRSSLGRRPLRTEVAVSYALGALR